MFPGPILIIYLKPIVIISFNAGQGDVKLLFINSLPAVSIIGIKSVRVPLVMFNVSIYVNSLVKREFNRKEWC